MRYIQQKHKGFSTPLSLISASQHTISSPPSSPLLSLCFVPLVSFCHQYVKGVQGHIFPSLKLGLFPISSHSLICTTVQPLVFKVTFILMLQLMEDHLLLKCGYSQEIRNFCVIVSRKENKLEAFLPPQKGVHRSQGGGV